MDGVSHLKMYPLLSIFSKPRATMRFLLNNRGLYRGLFFLIVVLAGVAEGFAETVDSLERWMLEVTPLWQIWLMVVISGVVAALFGLVFGALLTLWVGRLFGGKGTYRELIVALGWAHLPLALSLVLIPLNVWLYGDNLFLLDGVPIQEGLWATIAVFVELVGSFAPYVFYLFLTLSFVAEAHRFTIGRAVATLFLPLVVILVLVILVYSLI
ncbi:hypothetical protein CBW65_10400 [Tumebacillus avium]|uniref:Yip1 domain-containing protein n=1 Tax=Tumebacillus avium TaxID=1903704 RepID=A0A1Y0IPS0_9BACL|nr:Yip1 family protein [Tumebacillus avium]ARU61363.1 hypothetical protein CBW65_10400 [Tumebacillus avium]